MKPAQPVDWRFFKLTDQAGWEAWKAEHPDPSDAEMEAQFARFWEPMTSMTMEDFRDIRQPDGNHDVQP